MSRRGLLQDLSRADSEAVDHRTEIDPIILELNQLRLSKGMSLAALARACAMKRQQVSRILAGGTPNVGIGTIRRIAEALGTSFSLSEVDKL